MDVITNLWAGRAGLARTYWGWGVLGGLAWAVPLSLVTPGSFTAILAVLALVAYYVVVNTGVWRAATLYQGPAIWAGLAKAASGLGLLCIAALGILLTLALGAGSRQDPRITTMEQSSQPAQSQQSPKYLSDEEVGFPEKR